MINYSPTDADRADAKLIASASKAYEYGTPEWTKLQFAAADRIVSCYVGSDGEPQHEPRRDGSCRCGHRKARTN